MHTCPNGAQKAPMERGDQDAAACVLGNIMRAPSTRGPEKATFSPLENAPMGGIT
jgi:hypothetical protein